MPLWGVLVWGNVQVGIASILSGFLMQDGRETETNGPAFVDTWVTTLGSWAVLVFNEQPVSFPRD